jgi:hypothetical protein
MMKFVLIAERKNEWKIENQVVCPAYLNFFYWIKYSTGFRNGLGIRAGRVWAAGAVLF